MGYLANPIIQLSGDVSGPSNATTVTLAGDVTGRVGTALVVAAQGVAINATGGPMQFQNAADKGKKVQQVTTGTITTTAGAPPVCANNISVSWPATFASTPHVTAAAENEIVSIVWPGTCLSISTTTVSIRLNGSATTSQGTMGLMGVG